MSRKSPVRNIDWNKHYSRLEKLCRDLKGDRDKLKEAVQKDPHFKKVGWSGCYQKCVREGLIVDIPLSSRFRLHKLSERDQRELARMLFNIHVGFEDIDKDPRYKGISENNLRGWAQRHGFPVRKDKRRLSDKAREKAYIPRLRTLIFDGVLVDEKKGSDHVLDTLKSEFPEAAKGLTKTKLATVIENTIWTSKADEALRGVVGQGLPLERFTKHNAHIPESMVRRRAKEITGISNIQHPVTFLRGLGRIGELEGLDEAFQLPKSSVRHPIPIPGALTRVMVINGANIGLRHKRVIEDNPVRRALADANRRRDEAVFIANPFDIDARKAAGGLRILRSMALGLNTNKDLLDPSYQERLGHIIYETIAERFMNMLSGWAKITHRPGNVPEYDGQVYIILGYKEEEIIANAAAWELSYWTRSKQNEIEAEIKVVQSRLAEAKRYATTSKGIQKLEQELRDLSALKARHIVSNIGTEEMQRYARKVMHFVVKKLEESIPNSKVIGQGTTYVSIGSETVEFNIPSHLRVGDNLLSHYCSTYPARSVSGNAAETVVICHPYAVNFRATAREVNVDDKRAEARIFVAPIAVDGPFLRDALRDSVRSAHPISKVIFNSQFNAGVLRMNFYNGIVNADAIPIEALSQHSRLKPLKRPYDDNKYIWTMVATDPHFGSRSREEVWSEACKGSLGVSDAVIQMFRDAGLCRGGKLPIHIYTVNDDPTQGNHFDTHNQPHPRQMSYQDMEKTLRKATSRQEVERIALEQLRLRGSDWLEEQVIQVKERHIHPNVDFFANVLERGRNSGLIIRGVSNIHGVRYDKRDLGAINWGTGNHFGATVDDRMTEGHIYADYLRALLYGTLKWENKEALINRLVVAPLEGNQYFAWGTIKVPGGYEWAMELRANPPRLSSWADPLAGTVRNDAQRGDYGMFMTGRKVIKLYGDKHFFSTVKTDQVFYHLCASGTMTDPYGHRGFPPNNTGVSFVGIPVGGPEAGPILVRTMHVEHIRRYFEKPYKFDWLDYLPNPA